MINYLSDVSDYFTVHPYQKRLSITRAASSAVILRGATGSACFGVWSSRISASSTSDVSDGDGDCSDLRLRLNWRLGGEFGGLHPGPSESEDEVERRFIICSEVAGALSPGKGSTLLQLVGMSELAAQLKLNSFAISDTDFTCISVDGRFSAIMQL